MQEIPIAQPLPRTQTKRIFIRPRARVQAARPAMPAAKRSQPTVDTAPLVAAVDRLIKKLDASSEQVMRPAKPAPKLTQPVVDTVPLVAMVARLTEKLDETYAQVQGPLMATMKMVQSAAEQKPVTRGQAIAAGLHKWALPITQVLLGAAMVCVGVMAMEISIMVFGAATCVTGLAVCLTLLAGAIKPHPFDKVKEFFERRSSHDPDIYDEGKRVVLVEG